MFQANKSDILYSKTSLYFKNEKVSSKKRSCFKTKTMLDFSKEHKFKLGGEALDDFHIKIQLKSSTQILQKSMFCFKKKRIILTFSFVDSVLAELTLGPTENDSQGLHWKQMMEQPGERIFLLHNMSFCQSLA